MPTTVLWVRELREHAHDRDELVADRRVHEGVPAAPGKYLFTVEERRLLAELFRLLDAMDRANARRERKPA